jgi:hypothetical protein
LEHHEKHGRNEGEMGDAGTADCSEEEILAESGHEDNLDAFDDGCVEDSDETISVEATRRGQYPASEKER